MLHAQVSGNKLLMFHITDLLIISLRVFYYIFFIILPGFFLNDKLRDEGFIKYYIRLYVIVILWLFLSKANTIAALAYIDVATKLSSADVNILFQRRKIIEIHGTISKQLLL